MLRWKCLAILNLLITLPTRSPMVSLPRSGRLLALGGRGDGGQLGFGGGQQLVAFAGALGGQGRVAAAHQPLAGVVRVADLNQVVLIEQRQLQRVGLDEGLDLRGAQRSDPIQLGGTKFGVDARAGEHAPITDQGRPGSARTGP